MIWYAVELIPEDPRARFSDEAIVGKIRVGDDDNVHLFFDRMPPNGARARLVPISDTPSDTELPADFWDDYPPEIDFDGEVDVDTQRAVRRMNGGRR